MLSTNCYVVNAQQKKEAIIIDPGLEFSSETQQIFDYISERALNVKSILNTHGHQDHISGDAIIQKKFEVPIYIHKDDAASLEGLEKNRIPVPVLLENGSLIKLGDESLSVMHTPGHSPGSICLIGEKLVFSGDTLFAGGIGRTDFPGGSINDIKISLQKLANLPDNYLIYPGHGSTSTIGEEKSGNPFLNKNCSF
jgi:glyoxylase-like metal-dependent hydrolase (beta-lactamase superfamily II)